MEQIECQFQDKTCNHIMHIDSRNENNISSLSKGINSLVDMTSFYFSKLYNKVSSVKEKIHNLGDIKNLDLNNESKEILIKGK